MEVEMGGMAVYVALIECGKRDYGTVRVVRCCDVKVMKKMVREL